ncbi:hypothetical protein CTAYLR_001127 [Chrysophaeum taylorii]|uniref:Clathrin light chain n=1 Tax=Chrysophaeum taylorii TaxID=2483200 RepID=A0AAD7XNM5_9STRA|nr:hypothetical protein CTAYLR_001127 [Chrysophaeum taylorii]
MNGEAPGWEQLGDEYPKLAEFERQFAASLAAKEEHEQKTLAEKKAAAERDLDIFYDQLTDKKAQKQAQNREHEEVLRNQFEHCDNPFERVMQLIGHGAVAPDMQIMHSLLVRLKQAKHDRD